MTAEQFAYWLQGYAELNSETPTVEQWQSIREHLALVFTKVTPQIGWPATPLPSPPPLQQPYQPPSRIDCFTARSLAGGGRETFVLC